LFQFVGGERTFHKPELFVAIFRQEVSVEKVTGESLVVDAHSGDEVQTKEGQVVEVIAGEGFFFEVGMDQTQSTKAATSDTDTTEIRQEQPGGIADKDMLDVPTPVDQDADLPTEFKGIFGEGTQKVRGSDDPCREFAAIERRETFALAGLEPRRISV